MKTEYTDKQIYKPGYAGTTKRILSTLQRGNKSIYNNTSGYVHMGSRLDWGTGITGQ